MVHWNDSAARGDVGDRVGGGVGGRGVTPRLLVAAGVLILREPRVSTSSIPGP